MPEKKPFVHQLRDLPVKFLHHRAELKRVRPLRKAKRQKKGLDLFFILVQDFFFNRAPIVARGLFQIFFVAVRMPETPPVDGVRCVESLLGLVAAGPPDVELPPADEPLLVCATARELARVKAAASKQVVRCIRFPPIEGRL